MLLHGNSKTNADILDSVIKEIKAQGYEIKSLDEFEWVWKIGRKTWQKWEKEKTDLKKF